MFVELYLVIQGIVVAALFFWCCWWLINTGLNLPIHVESLRVELYDGQGFQKWKTIIYPLYAVLCLLSMLFNLCLGAIVVGTAYSVAKDVRDWWQIGKNKSE